MDLESRRLLKLEKMMKKVFKYLDRFRNIFGQRLDYKEKSEIVISNTPPLNHVFDKLKSKNQELEEENKILVNKLEDINLELTYFLNLLANSCSLYILRRPKELWTREIVTLFLLKSFEEYNFEKCRFSSIHKKEIIADCFSVNEIRITDQVNLFVNQILKENKYNIKDVLISEEKLLKWKYRLLLKEDPTLTYEDLKIKFNKGE